ncbi:chromatin target of PRMT1 protein-like isoform X2 [Myripristis murdjan]|uniref:chromatin target of PRMT1 protein-like isoform X2 n=1 Tax=Myripristis murdjan TaxID=586833 RepID=UPI001176113C|nr:chromatin target of PRMT1 protein-like isoform X2 [Myripristis murdjan]
MAASTSDTVTLRSTTAVSLHDRFTQMLMLPMARPAVLTFDPSRRRRSSHNQQLVLLMEDRRSVRAALPAKWGVKRCPGKASVWSRLGSLRGPRRFCGVWNFRHFGLWSFRRRYRWGAGTRRYKRSGLTHRNISSAQLRLPVLARLGGRVVARRSAAALPGTSTRKQPGQRARGGSGGQDSRKEPVTKKELDAQLDDYMSMSKSRLDAELDDYMSMTKSRLDAQLDEYMAMAGDYHLD